MKIKGKNIREIPFLILRKIVYKFKQPFIGFSELVISILRPTPFNNNIKATLLRIRGAKIGENVFIDRGVWVGNYPSMLEVDDNAVLSKDVIVTTSGGVKIGKRTLIGYGTKILSTNHIIPDNISESIRYSGHEQKHTVIEEDVWIGANVVITAGINVGKGSVVAAGAVVTKDIESYSIVGGIPAKLIRSRVKS